MEAITQYGQDIGPKIIPIVEDAKRFIIATHDALTIANDKRRGIKSLIKEVVDTFGPIKQKTHEAHKEAVAQEKKYLEPLETADKILQDNMGKYLMVEEQKRKEEEARLAEIACKEQEKILSKATKKIDALLEKAGDIDKQIETLERELNHPDISDVEAQVVRGRLESLMSKKRQVQASVEKAQVKIEQAVTPVMVIPQLEKPKVEGMSFRTEKVGEVINKFALIKAVAAGNYPTDLLEVNEGVLKKLVNAGMVIPGVEVRERPIVGTRK